MNGTSLAVATIIDCDHHKTVKCMFNPTDYTLSKSNTWSAIPRKGFSIGNFEFSNGGPTTLAMSLFFDTYSNVKGSGQPEDVRNYTHEIWDMMKVDPLLSLLDNAGNALIGAGTAGATALLSGGGVNPAAGASAFTSSFSSIFSFDSIINMLKGRPPFVRFQWGSISLFQAVITSLTEKFTLFMPDGTPVRSEMTVSFQEIHDRFELPWTNPTSGGTGGERVWKVNKGDTLAWIAYKEYGHSKYWRLIADANHLTRVRRLEPGMILEIPNA